MSKVVADPVALRALAARARADAARLEEVAQGLSRTLQGTAWEDGERRRFEKDLDDTLRTVRAAAEQLRDEHARVLDRKAAALEQFLR